MLMENMFSQLRDSSTITLLIQRSVMQNVNVTVFCNATHRFHILLVESVLNTEVSFTINGHLQCSQTVVVDALTESPKTG